LATILTSCPNCEEELELGTLEVIVSVCSSTNQGAYLFRCPKCHAAINKYIESRLVDLLVASGVRLKVWHLPAELDEPHGGPEITLDDIIDLHYALDRDTDVVFAELNGGS
jgi:hypothetical protein